MTKKHLTLVALFMIFPLIVGLACLSSTPNSSAPSQPILADQENGATTEPMEQEKFQELVLLDNNFWTQRSGAVFVSYLFQNLNSNVIFNDVEYTIQLFDSSGSEIEMDYGTIPEIYPNQTFGVVSNFYLEDESITINTVSIDWEYAKTSSADETGYQFSITNAIFWENNASPMVTGIISNNAPETVTDVRANIICFNENGDIVGGGLTFLDFIPGQEYMGFVTYVETFDTVAAVEVYPATTLSSNYYDHPDLWSRISVLDDYFYVGEFDSLLGGVVIKNETDAVLRNSILYVTVYDDADNVTSTLKSYINILLPGDTLGISPWGFPPPDGAVSSGFDTLVLPGVVDDNYELQENPFVINSYNVTGEYDNYVTVNFSNHYSKQVSEVEVYVLVYNAEGQIVGGGNDWTPAPTPAGGSSEIDVWVFYDESQTIDSIQAWVTPSIFTNFE